MNKLFNKIATGIVGIALAIGVGVAVGNSNSGVTKVHADTLSYTLTSKYNSTGSTDSSSAITGTAVSSYFTGGTSNVTSVTSNKCYLGGYSGLKFGSSSGKGTITISLASVGQVKASKVEFYLAGYESSAKTVILKLNGATSGTGYLSYTLGTTKGSYSTATVNWDGKTSLTSIALEATNASSNRFYLQWIKVYVAETTNVTVSFNANGHGTAPASQTFASGGKATDPGAPTGTTTGYEFGGWYEEAACTNAWNFNTTISANKTLWAKWTADTYAINYYDQGGSTFSGTHESGYPIHHVYGTDTTLKSATKTGYSFEGWFSNSACTGNAVTTLGATAYTAAINLYAKWDQITNVTVSEGTFSKTYSVDGVWDWEHLAVTYTTQGGGGGTATGLTISNFSFTPPAPDDTSINSVSVTATYNGVTSDSITISNITVTEKQYIGGIVDGEKYFIIAAWNGTEYYLNGFSSTTTGSALGLVWPGDDNAPTDDTDAWTFTKGFDDDVWRVTSEEYDSQLYSISDNNGLRATKSPEDDDQWEIELYNSNIYMRNTKFDSQKGEYLTVFSNPDFRTYSSRSAQDAQGGTPSIIRFVHYVAPKTLNSLTVSGATSTFTAGDNFSLGNATITAVYSDESVVIPTNNSGLSFKLDGSTITTSDVLTSADNGKSLVIRYTDAESRYADADGYTITVNPKAVQSVTLDKNSATITKSGTVDLTARVSDQYAIQTIKWLTSEPTIATLSSTTSTSGNSITVTGSSSNTGTSVITAYVDENSNNTLDSGEKSATCSVTVSADPVLNMYDESSSNVTSGSINKFTSSANFYLNVVAEGFQGTITYTWSSSNTSAVSIDEQVDEMCEFDVNSAGDARLSCHAVGATSGNLTVYVDVHVKEPAVSSVTWSASNIDVFTNVSLTSSTVSSWDAQYDLEDGSHGYLAFGQYDLYIGSAKVTSLPRQWLASDDGETMHIEYGGVSSSSVSVSVTQYINAITKKTSTDHNFSWAQTVSSPIAFSNSDTSITLGGVAWTKNSQSETFSVQGSGTRRYIQIGKSATANSITLRTSAISGTITRIAVDCAKGSNGTSTLTATVGGETFIPTTTMNSFTNNVGGIISEEGSASGEVVITMSASGTSGKQMYLHSIEIDYTTSSSETISNLSAHKNAQKAAVKFAKAFNTAMNGANVCSGTFENLSAGWSNASSAYTQFLTDISSLSSSEQDWAKDLLANATAQWGSDADEACVERAMKTYEFCVSHYKGTCNAFMSEIRPVKSIHISPLVNILGGNSSASVIVIIVSLISVTAIGGYFFFRRKSNKEIL